MKIVKHKFISASLNHSVPTQSTLPTLPDQLIAILLMDPKKHLHDALTDAQFSIVLYKYTRMRRGE